MRYDEDIGPLKIAYGSSVPRVIVGRQRKIGVRGGGAAGPRP